MGSVAEATRAKDALSGTYVDELCNPGEVLTIRFARIYGSGPTSPTYAARSPQPAAARPFGRAASLTDSGGRSPRAAGTPTANGKPAAGASSLASAPSGSSLASSSAGGGGAAAAAPAPPLLPPAQRCGSCGAAESATLVLRRCSACKVGGAAWGGEPAAAATGVLLPLQACRWACPQSAPGSACCSAAHFLLSQPTIRRLWLTAPASARWGCACTALFGAPRALCPAAAKSWPKSMSPAQPAAFQSPDAHFTLA